MLPLLAQTTRGAHSGWLDNLISWSTTAFEVAGVAAIIIGALIALIRFLRAWFTGTEAFRPFRSDLGRSILLGLELLVAADIIATVAVEPTMKSVLVLGLIVLIRTFLSFSLEIEIEGRLPWQQREADASTR